jgi:glycosyltransferase involved in cell wall biosynthesis
MANISSINGCVVIPTFNNEKTLERVVMSVLQFVPKERLILINDGSTDSTEQLLKGFPNGIHILHHAPNQGKGYALRKGFKHAISCGYSNAITLDSDGQHFPEDLPKMIAMALEHPRAVLMGTRNMEQEGVPQKSSFGNKFSNFWFKVETGITLPDTQTGFRLYPLEPLKKMTLFTHKFELEIEVIVRLAWKKVAFVPVPIRVKYDPEERVSHFRPGRDFFRISVLNSLLVIVALLYYYPKKLFSFDTFKRIKEEAIKKDETNLSKAASIAFGVLIGILPIWGFQLLVGIPIAILLRMNKVLFIAAANISVPPMIPLILYASVAAGQLAIDGVIDHSKMVEFSFESVSTNFGLYAIGAVIFAFVSSLIAFMISFVLLSIFRKKPTIQE